MDKHQKKKILSKYLDLKQQTQYIKEQYEELRSVLESAKAQQLSDMPKGSAVSFDKIGNGISRLDEYYEKFANMADEYIKIEKAIARLECMKQREMMRLRYIKGYRVENIAVEMKYSFRTIKRIHARALENIILEDNK